MKKKKNARPIAARFDTTSDLNLDANLRADVFAADIVFAVDTMTDNEHLIYGRPLLERIARGRKPVLSRVLTIGVDQDAGELKRLVELVRVVKGRVDYLDGTDDD